MKLEFPTTRPIRPQIKDTSDAQNTINPAITLCDYQGQAYIAMVVMVNDGVKRGPKGRAAKSFVLGGKRGASSSLVADY